MASRIELATEDDKGWPAIRLRRGPLELSLVPAIGGRLMGVRWDGRDLLYTDPTLEGHRGGATEAIARSGSFRELGFPLWGGDKTWLAPQTGWEGRVPFPDLDSEPYAVDVHRESDVATVAMTSRVCRTTGIEIRRCVRLEAGRSDWSITHRLRNRSTQAATWAPWSVTMLRRAGRVYLPRRAESPYPDGVKTYTGERDSEAVRGRVLSALGALAVLECRDPAAYKFGVDAAEGWIAGVVTPDAEPPLVFTKSVPWHAGRTYAHGCIAEAYNSHAFPYFEMEIHGPLARLGPGEEASVVERQSVRPLGRWPEREEDVRGWFAG